MRHFLLLFAAVLVIAAVVVGAAHAAPPPAFVLPTDPDGDGLYEDLNGNGRADFQDVVLYWNNMDTIAASGPPMVALFDYNRNGRIDFADPGILFRKL